MQAPMSYNFRGPIYNFFAIEVYFDYSLPLIKTLS